jgi:hypothetical protein
VIRHFTEGDIVTSGDHFLTGKEATAQAITRRLKLFLGEYFLNISEGTPWFQEILGKSSRDMAAANIKSRILDTDGVVALGAFSFDFDAKTRMITVNASVIDKNNEALEYAFNEEVI